MAAPPPVSVCLTTYNRGEVLPRSIESLQAQTFSDFELIINDDCSPDATEEVCRDYAARDPRVKYFRNTENLKMPGNLNAAIGRASGELVANLHDGDWYRPELLEKWKAALDDAPGAGFVFNHYEVVDRDGSSHIATFGPPVNGAELARHFFRTFTSCVWGTVMARASAYRQTGPFDARYGFISDVDMWLRLGRDHDVAYVPEPLITITPREPTHPYAFMHWRVELWTLAIYRAHLECYRKVIPEEVARFREAYPARRRRKLLQDMALCVKHRRWDRLREGLAIWRDADDPVLRALGRSLGRSADAPAWYSPEAWTLG
jgi:glycosyltransferase involved in cell wall biosynthesis